MSGRPSGACHESTPLARSAVRAWASANAGLVGPSSAMPLPNRLTVSTPALTNTSPSPALIACAAMRIVWSDDEQ